MRKLRASVINDFITIQTSDNIQMFNNKVERKIKKGEKLFMVFVDLKAAFDSIERRMIWKCLEGRGNSGKYLW